MPDFSIITCSSNLENLFIPYPSPGSSSFHSYLSYRTQLELVFWKRLFIRASDLFFLKCNLNLYKMYYCHINSSFVRDICWSILFCNARTNSLRIFFNIVSRVLRMFLSVCLRKVATSWQEYPRMASWYNSSFWISFSAKIALEITASDNRTCKEDYFGKRKCHNKRIGRRDTA